MAETSRGGSGRGGSGRGGSSKQTVYIPPPGLNVQTNASEEYPGGQVVHMQEGYTELTPTLEKSPFMRNLVPESSEENERRMALRQADQERAEAVGKAQVEYYEESIRLDEEGLEAMRQAEAERAQRYDEANQRGVTISEPHPDPEAQWSIALTQGPEHHMVSAAGMASKIVDEGARPAPPPGSGGGGGSGESGGNEEPTAPPQNRDVPLVTGDGSVGSPLNCTMGNWDGMKGATADYAYQWKADGSDVGDGSNSYTPTESDVGKSVNCVVTATNNLGSSEAPASNSVQVQAAGASRSGGSSQGPQQRTQGSGQSNPPIGGGGGRATL